MSWRLIRLRVRAKYTAPLQSWKALYALSHYQLTHRGRSRGWQAVTTWQTGTVHRLRRAGLSVPPQTGPDRRSTASGLCTTLHRDPVTVWTSDRDVPRAPSATDRQTRWLLSVTPRCRRPGHRGCSGNESPRRLSTQTELLYGYGNIKILPSRLLEWTTTPPEVGSFLLFWHQNDRDNIAKESAFLQGNSVSQ